MKVPFILVTFFVFFGCVDGSVWNWVHGSNDTRQIPVYNTSHNEIGARDSALSWIDSNGIAFVYGGEGWDTNSSFGPMSDLWSWNGVKWTFLHGSGIANRPASYGAPGASTNTPGGRTGATTWIDGSNKLWLFGGQGELNDMWSWDGTAWTWVAGANTPQVHGIYGTRGVASAQNYPGSRSGAKSWFNIQTNTLYLFGGVGLAASGNTGYLNDLWTFSGSAWTWISGSNKTQQIGVYGTQYVESPSNVPGSRSDGCSWLDKNGNLWLFGGLGHGSGSSQGVLQDLWMFNITSGFWTFFSGTDLSNQPGTYEYFTEPSASGLPGGRSFAQCATVNGNMWLFGGYGYDNSTIANLNDLWLYNVLELEWTWLAGGSMGNELGYYTNTGFGYPGARQASAVWQGNGTFYIFGGYGYSAVNAGQMNDLWKFDTSVALTTGAVTTGHATTGSVTRSSSGQVTASPTSTTGVVAATTGIVDSGTSVAGWKIGVGIVVALVGLVLIVVIFFAVCGRATKKKYTFELQSRRGTSQLSLDNDN